MLDESHASHAKWSASDQLASLSPGGESKTHALEAPPCGSRSTAAVCGGSSREAQTSRSIARSRTCSPATTRVAPPSVSESTPLLRPRPRYLHAKDLTLSSTAAAIGVTPPTSAASEPALSPRTQRRNDRHSPGAATGDMASLVAPIPSASCSPRLPAGKERPSPTRLRGLDQEKWHRFLAHEAALRQRRLVPIAATHSQSWMQRIFYTEAGEAPWPWGSHFGVQHLIAIALIIFIVVSLCFYLTDPTSSHARMRHAKQEAPSDSHGHDRHRSHKSRLSAALSLVSHGLKRSDVTGDEHEAPARDREAEQSKERQQHDAHAHDPHADGRDSGDSSHRSHSSPSPIGIDTPSTPDSGLLGQRARAARAQRLEQEA